MGEKEINMKVQKGRSGAPRKELDDKVSPHSVGMRPSVLDALDSLRLQLPTSGKSRAVFVEAVVALCVSDSDVFEQVCACALRNESQWKTVRDELRAYNKSLE